jgi:hypothetical protein
VRGTGTTTRGSGPTRRLLLVPLLLLVVLIAALQLLEAATPRTVDPELAVEVPAPAAESEARTCSRDGDQQAIEDARGALGNRPVVSSGMVQSCPAAYDGVAVRYAGEVVGDLLMRDGGAWVLVNDDDYALQVGPLPAHGEHVGTNTGLTVWLPTEHHDAVTGLGRPNRRGDILAIEGRIERADPQDGGGLTLRASDVEVLAPSTEVAEPLDMPQLWFTVAMTVVAAGLWLLRRRAEAL